MGKLRQDLQLKQQLKLSPLQMQVVRLLEINSLQMEQRVRYELENNPTLEEASSTEEVVSLQEAEQEGDTPDDQELEAHEEDEFSLEDLLPDEEDYQEGDYRENFYSSGSVDDWRESNDAAPTGDFRSHLIEQLGFQRLDSTLQKVAEYIVGNLDNDGYLRRPLQSIADDILLSTGEELSLECVEEALQLVQSLDPPGIGATSLANCLILQLQHIDSEPARLAKKVIEEGFDDFSNKRFDKVRQRFHLTEEDLQQVMDTIVTLNPKPGGDLDDSMLGGNQPIVPDFILEIDHNVNDLKLMLNGSNLPELRVSKSYRTLLQNLQNKRAAGEKTSQVKETAQFVKSKIQSAHWFIDAVRQRNNTLLRVMQTIVAMQRDYFLEGDDSLVKPLTLKDVAEAIDMDISTVSRSVMNKYVQTPFGIRPLRDFFSQALTQVQGQEVSAREVKAAIVEIIDAEDKQNPLTDDQLNMKLQERGYDTARRTVSKYRIQLNIPVARLRREL